jgi:hypothetical protein
MKSASYVPNSELFLIKLFFNPKITEKNLYHNLPDDIRTYVTVIPCELLQINAYSSSREKRTAASTEKIASTRQ